MNTMIKQLTKTSLCASLLFLNACGLTGNLLNPFYEPPSQLALQGEKNDHALRGNGAHDEGPRKALDAIATYQAAQPAQPNKPVMYPAVVRKMWIPDHLNAHGDLIPSHYYYVQVLNDRPAVTDAFELEGQLGKTGSAGNAGIPYVTGDDLKNKGGN